MTVNIYQEYGYKNRNDYLRSLADNHDVPFEVVAEIAHLLGEEKDFEELVNAIAGLSQNDIDLLTYKI